MNLNEFTTHELKELSDMLQSKIYLKRELVIKSKLDGFKRKYQKEINTYELMRVKINNSLGKFD